MNVHRYRDLIVGVIFLTGSIGYYLLSFQTPKSEIPGDIGNYFIPHLIALISGLLSLMLIASSYLALRQTKATPQKPAEADAEAVKELSAKTRYLPVVGTVALLFAYIYALEPVGFIVASATYLFLQFNISAPADRRGAKAQLRYALTSIVAAIAINSFFVNIFDVMLPQGLLD